MVLARSVIRVRDIEDRNMVIDAVNRDPHARISDFGNDGQGDTPLWLEITRMYDYNRYTEEEMERWKACGRTKF